MILKIGAHTYTIIYKELEDNDGLLLRDKQEIHISSKLQGTEQFCTLIHEILHVINNELGEKEIEYLAQAMTQVLLDNPNIMALHLHTPKQKKVIRQVRKTRKK